MSLLQTANKQSQSAVQLKQDSAKQFIQSARLKVEKSDLNSIKQSIGCNSGNFVSDKNYLLIKSELKLIDDYGSGGN